VTLVAFLGLAVLLAADAMTWSDALAERNAWDVFVWYGGLLTMGTLNRTGSTAALAGYVGGWFARDQLVPGADRDDRPSFLRSLRVREHHCPHAVDVSAVRGNADRLGTPPTLAVYSLACMANLTAASRTMARRRPDRVRRGLRYPARLVAVGFAMSVVNILIWTVVGFAWWKVVGFW
jgi:DASS family divalent anion:Na+ symporter